MNPIPDNDPVGFTVDMWPDNVPDVPVVDLDLELHVLHPFVGDLKAVLTHTGSGRTAVLIDRPGRDDTGAGCSSNNIHVILDDEGTGGPIEDFCSPGDTENPTSPPNYTPNEPLSVFKGLMANGQWQLTLIDAGMGDAGTFDYACLHINANPDVMRSCDGNSLFGQEPSSGYTVWQWGASNETDGTLQYELMPLHQGFINHLTWWGTEATETGKAPCQSAARTFDIGFYTEKEGMPYALYAQLGGQVVADRMPTGLSNGTDELFRYEASLDPTYLPPEARWFSIQSLNDSDCRFYWVAASLGDGFSYTSIAGEQSMQWFDLAYCMSGPPEDYVCDHNRILDGGFEWDNTFLATAPWTESSSSGWGLITNHHPRTGTWHTWLGGTTEPTTDIIHQDVVIPPASSASLEFYLMIAHENGDPNDLLRVRIDGNTVMEFRNTLVTPVYMPFIIPLDAYADGTSHNIQFIANVNGTASSWTSFYVDDVCLTAEGMLGNGSLNGTVLDAATWAPISGARVTLWNSPEGVRSQFTGPLGEFSLDNLPAWTYDIQVDKYRHITEILEDIPVFPGLTTTQNVMLVSTNTPPIANAGPDQSAPAATTVYLDGSGSSDADGDALSFSWSFLSRPAGSIAVLNNPQSALPVFIMDRAGAYVLQLIVSDGLTDSNPDTLTITATGTDAGYLNGTVTSLGYDDGHPAPLAGARVEVWRESAMVDSRLTTVSGHYEFILAPASNYEIHVEAPWHDSGVAQGVVVLSGAPTTQDFDLRTHGDDNCAAATRLWEGEIRSASLSYATGLAPSSCGILDLNDAWWYYTPTTSGMATISTCGSSADTTLAIFDACGGNEIACNDNGCGIGSIWTDKVEFGQTYYVRVSSNNVSWGSYNISVSLVPDPVEGESEGEWEGEQEGETEGEMEVGICPGIAVFGQSPAPSPSPLSGAAISEGYLGYRVYEDFNAPDCVDTVRWWGVENTGNGTDPCSRSPHTFQIDFIEDVAGQPTGSWITYGVTATRSDTGVAIAGLPIYLYEATLDSPVCLPIGWVSILGAGESDCAFAWYTSDEGNQAAYQDWPGDPLKPLTEDMAVCLSWSGNEGEGEVWEADVAPRPDGDSQLLVNDWVQVGRFVAGLDVPSPGSEFQRADCAPLASLGDGQILVNDWVQAGRYVAGLDAPQEQGGPTAPAIVPKSETPSPILNK